jgi:hypothetical protein
LHPQEKWSVFCATPPLSALHISDVPRDQGGRGCSRFLESIFTKPTPSFGFTHLTKRPSPQHPIAVIRLLLKMPVFQRDSDSYWKELHSKRNMPPSLCASCHCQCAPATEMVTPLTSLLLCLRGRLSRVRPPTSCRLVHPATVLRCVSCQMITVA